MYWKFRKFQEWLAEEYNIILPERKYRSWEDLIYDANAFLGEKGYFLDLSQRYVPRYKIYGKKKRKVIDYFYYPIYPEKIRFPYYICVLEKEK